MQQRFPIVSLLLVGLNNYHIPAGKNPNLIKKLFHYIKDNFQGLSQTEVAVGYAGLVVLARDQCDMLPQIEDIKNQIMLKYGFRL